jgi:hypothetical protein
MDCRVKPGNDKDAQKTKRTGPGKPEPMRLEQGLLPCQFIFR